MTDRMDAAIIGSKIAWLSNWIDNSANNSERDPEALMWGRISKIGEELGETIQEMIGYTGQNPRKGHTGGYERIMKELLDVATTALSAHEHMIGNTGSSMKHLSWHIDALIERAKTETGAE